MGQLSVISCLSVCQMSVICYMSYVICYMAKTGNTRLPKVRGTWRTRAREYVWHEARKARDSWGTRPRRIRGTRSTRTCREWDTWGTRARKEWVTWGMRACRSPNLANSKKSTKLIEFDLQIELAFWDRIFDLLIELLSPYRIFVLRISYYSQEIGLLSWDRIFDLEIELVSQNWIFDLQIKLVSPDGISFLRSKEQDILSFRLVFCSLYGTVMDL